MEYRIKSIAPFFDAVLVDFFESRTFIANFEFSGPVRPASLKTTPKDNWNKEKLHTLFLTGPLRSLAPW